MGEYIKLSSKYRIFNLYYAIKKFIIIMRSTKNGLYMDSDGDMVWYKDNVIHKEGAPAITNINSKDYECWFINGKIHRLDGPAIKDSDRKQWYIDGVRHRIGGPAIEYTDGDYEWYIDGKRHREDGPAFVIDGAAEWYLDGKQYSEVEFKKQLLIKEMSGIQ